MAQLIIMTIILIVVVIMQLLGRCGTSLSNTLLQYWYNFWWAVKYSIDCQCLKWRSSAGPFLTLSFCDLLSVTSSSEKFPVCADYHIKPFLSHFNTVQRPPINRRLLQTERCPSLPLKINSKKYQNFS
jgi:hypothetical protein